VGPNLKDVVQHVALAFSTSLLYLMVQPRPEVIDESLAKIDSGELIQLVMQREFLFSGGIVLILLNETLH
jgi:hypothetical protein